MNTELSKWHEKLCADMTVELIHVPPTAEFVTMNYNFMTTSADRWIKVLPDKNSHVGSHTIKLRIKFTDPDYSLVYEDVSVSIEVLPCEIK